MTVEVCFFGEDNGHESFCVPLIKRVATELGCTVKIRVLCASGGRGRVMNELAAFVAAVSEGDPAGDLIVVATDSNCQGRAKWEAKVRSVCEPLVLQAEGLVVTLTPDPHVERWMLLDSAAFKQVFSKGCAAPDKKCERGRYKDLLLDSIAATGVEPLFGGMEFADEVVGHLDLDSMLTADDSLGTAIDELRRVFTTLSGNAV